MLDAQRPVLQSPSDPAGLMFKDTRPSWVVVDKQNAAVQRLDLAHVHGTNRFVGLGPPVVRWQYLQIVVLCRRAGAGKPQTLVQSSSACIHSKDSKLKRLLFHVRSVDQSLQQDRAAPPPLERRQQEDFREEELRRSIFN